MKKKLNVMSIFKMDTNEILLKMKLLTLMMFAAFVSASANSYSQATKFNLNMKDVTISDVFQKIEEQSEFVILFNEKTLNVNRKVDVTVTDETVDKILDQIFEGDKDAYKILDRQIAIYPNEINESASGINIELIGEQQKKVLSGTVKDSKGLPLPGVSVVVKGNTIGTISDTEGQFRLSLPSDAKVLVFSFVGMKSQEIAITGKTSVNIVMEEETLGVEEVVVVGYGTQKKVNLTGAIGVASSERLENRTINSVGQGLQGVIPGLNITFASGEPAQPADFNIRGFESINGGEPLILIDGIPMNPNTINPDDVESVSVLKDASAAAIYGARAAFGVVLITTKKGKIDKTRVNLSTQLTMNKPIYLGYGPIPKEQAGTARQIMDDAYRVLNNNELFNPKVIAAAIAYQEMDNPTKQDAWYPLDGQLYYLGYIDAADKLINNNVMQQKYDLSINGASKKASYYLSIGATDVPGFYKYGNEQYNRYNVFSKVDINITDWLKFEEKITVNNTVIDNPHRYSESDGYNQVWAHPFFTPMEFPDLDQYLVPGDRGKYEQYIGMHNSSGDIIPYRKEGGRDKTNQIDIWLTQGITITPLKGLTINGDFSYNYFWQHGENLHKELEFVKGSFNSFDLTSPPYTTASSSYPTYMIVSETANHYYVLNTYAEYVPENLGNHYLKVMGGFNQEYGYFQNFYSKGNNIIHPNVAVVGATSVLKK